MYTALVATSPTSGGHCILSSAEAKPERQLAAGPQIRRKTPISTGGNDRTSERGLLHQCP
jgi:predicted phage gp36 major capsid-like protein